MKARFSTIDIRVAVSELRSSLLSLRVANVYDVDHRTYLIKLARPDQKAMILIESGNKIHSTEYEWPKHTTPSGFSMKLRKHLRTRRLEKIEMLGIDRIVDLQFGSDEAAYHVIVELYDRGNIVLTDYEYTILNILRPRTDESQDVRFAVREQYPLAAAKQPEPLIQIDRLKQLLTEAKDGDNLKKVLNPHLVYGAALIEHCLLKFGLKGNTRIGKEFDIEKDIGKLHNALEDAENYLQETEKPCKGYIIQKREKKAIKKEGESDEILTYTEFHPFLFTQHQDQPFDEFETFNKAVDEFFSKLESQKLDVKAIQQEKTALKKLENVKKDHEKRLETLQKEQDKGSEKAALIESNQILVDKAIKVVCSAVANQIDWTEIGQIVKEAQIQGDPVASAITNLKLDTNHITMLLRMPEEGSDEESLNGAKSGITPMKIDIDLSLTAYANARKYYDIRRSAGKKEQKTIDASKKALKQVEKKTKEKLKEVAVTASINKARKTYWFEKFIWFISSENYLVIGGRDQQQNEIIVKRYLNPGDLYVHADLHGASSVIIKNPSGDPVPPKTLNEAGVMAVCNSAAWDSKVVTSAWWVYHNQVSKTAPTGEYLTTGSFMIRGKKNMLPPCYLVYGFGFIFKLDEDSIYRHKGERRVRTAEEDAISVITKTESEATEQDVEISDSESDTEDTKSETTSESNVTENDDLLKDDRENESEESDSESETETKFENETETKNDSETETKKESETEPKKDGENVLKDDNDDDDDEENAFPDTNISLQHVAGDKFELQKKIGYTGDMKVELDPQIATLLNVNEKSDKVPSKSRLSAKQRKLMKKAKNKGENYVPGQEQEDEDNDKNAADDMAKEIERELEAEKARKKEERIQEKEKQQQVPLKRGQKAKLKKIKEKYGDQDEEERIMRMQILASAGEKKEDKKKKGKKGNQQDQQKQQNKKRPASVPNQNLQQKIVQMKIKGDGNDSDEEKQAVLEEENIWSVEDSNLLDSFTGCPVEEDGLLFSTPFVAPYSSMTNFKYKVKLIPGNTKRGKAAKTALNMFLHDKTGSSRERDLLKSTKDTDLSRNIPGKVKVAAANLNKNRKK